MSESTDAMLRLLAMLPQPSRDDVVRLYRETLLGQIGALQQALAPGGDGAQRLAHQIAGSAAMMQDQALSVVARAMEHALREGRPQDASGRWPELQACAAETLAALLVAYP